jgi:hypothetical protein
VPLPAQRIHRHKPAERFAEPRLLPHGWIGNPGPSLAGLPSTKVGNVHAVSQSRFALNFDKIMQITASVSGAFWLGRPGRRIGIRG